MVRFRKKPPDVQRNPQPSGQKQSVFHYSSNRAPAERTRTNSDSSDLKKSSARLFFGRVPVVLGVIFFTAICIFAVLLTAPPKVIVEGGPARSNQKEYEIAAKELSSGWSGQTKLTLNRQKISTELSGKFFELDSVEVSTPLLRNSAVIKLHVSEPLAILKTLRSDYLLDSRGVAVMNLENTSSVKGLEKLISLSDQSDASIELGKPALTTAQVDFIKEVRRQAEAKKIGLEDTLLTEGGGELHVRFKGLAYFVKFNPYEDARKSFGTFNAVREHMAASGERPVEYVDVRVPERAYIK